MAILCGKESRTNGFAAMFLMGLVALGCTCKDFGNSSKNDNSTTVSNTTSTSNTSSTPVVEPADASTGQVPVDAQLQELARTTILDFNDALQSKDFTEFHRNISKPFQKEASPARFRQVFQSFIDARIDFSEVRSLKANFTTPASIDKSLRAKTLKLKGNYAISPRRANFELKYIPEGRDWKLIYIEINTKE